MYRRTRQTQDSILRARDLLRRLREEAERANIDVEPALTRALAALRRAEDEVACIERIIDEAEESVSAVTLSDGTQVEVVYSPIRGRYGYNLRLPNHRHAFLGGFHYKRQEGALDAAIRRIPQAREVVYELQ